MKKFIILFTLVVFCSVSAYSQFVPFFPSEQIDHARTQAESSLDNPQLVSIGALNGTLPGLEFPPGTPLPVNFYTDDENKGKSDAWVYVFNEIDDPENIQAFAIGNIAILGLQTVNLTDMGVPLGALVEYLSDTPLDGVQWINSDELVDKLTVSSLYIDFMEANQDAEIKMVVLGSADYEFLNPSTSYWFVGVGGETDSTVIIINALDGTVVSVEDSYSIRNNLQIYPNPGYEYTTITIPEDLIGNQLNAIVSDNSGSVIFSKEIYQYSQTFTIDFSNYVNGKYFIKISGNGKSITSQFVISK
jgi:type IX secretion system substrate protein